MRTPILNRLLQEIEYEFTSLLKRCKSYEFTSFLKDVNRGASEQKVLLGRWNPLRCTKKEERVVYYANMDHCGDCGKVVLENKNNDK